MLVVLLTITPGMYHPAMAVVDSSKTMTAVIGDNRVVLTDDISSDRYFLAVKKNSVEKEE